jgi:hypothetical protein
MKKSIVLFWSALFAIETVKTSNASTLADWTFESSSLASYVPGANTATTNFYADLGLEAGTAAVFGLPRRFCDLFKPVRKRVARLIMFHRLGAR